MSIRYPLISRNKQYDMDARLHGYGYDDGKPSYYRGDAIALDRYQWTEQEAITRGAAMLQRVARWIADNMPSLQRLGACVTTGRRSDRVIFIEVACSEMSRVCEIDVEDWKNSVFNAEEIIVSRVLDILREERYFAARTRSDPGWLEW